VSSHRAPNPFGGNLPVRISLSFPSSPSFFLAATGLHLAFSRRIDY
jgi:hypothetical protein